ncbi:MAG TPA: hypothetical protein VFK97_01005, partial [Candidatus Saccharimonadales bacterium]|nr:hypothetical protein [Candidatus Saccharimonadales bacterium]
MAPQTLDPRQEDEAADPASVDELEALHRLPSAERKDPVSADDLQNQFALPSSEEPVYDRPGYQPDDEVLSAGRSSGEADSAKPGTSGPKTNHTPDRDQLNLTERLGGKSQPQHEHQIGAGYHEAANLIGRFAGIKNFNRKRALFGGGILGTIITIILSLSYLSGPAQFIQLSQLLGHNFTKSQSDTEKRTTHLLRDFKAIKTGDYRYTRVGLMGARVMARVVGQFEDAGVKFTGSDILGRPTGIEVSQSKVAANNPEVKGMGSQEFDAWLNQKFNVDTGLSFENGKLDIRGLKSQAISSFINKAGTQLLGDNAIVSSLKVRSLKDFFGLSSLFHPFSRAIQDRIAAKAAEIQKQKPNESSGEAETEAAAAVEDEVSKTNLGTIEEPGVESFGGAKAQESSFSSKIGSKLLPGAGLLWATGCTLKGVSGAIVTMNRTLTVLPAAVEATTLIGAGAQVQNGGSDISLDQLGATEKGFTDNAGQTIWSGAALQALGNSNTNTLPKNSKGQIANDLPGEYKQAFGTSTTASTINSVGDVMLSWYPFHWLSVPGLSECGFVSGIVITVAGVFSQAVLGIINLPDGEVGDAAIQAAATAGEDVAINTIQGQLLSPLINNVVDRIARATAAPALARSAFKGAVGGDLIAYGARAAANSSAILGGGLALGNTASTIIGSAGQEQQKQFNAEGTFAKIFNVNDYRSLAGRLAMAISPNPLADIRLGLSKLFNVGGNIASLFGAFLPHAKAASDSWTGNYDWGFP